MAQSTEKNLHEVDSASGSVDHGTTDVVMPVGRKYRPVKIGPITIPHYASPATQLVIVAFVCFLCPGMFNALSCMGGGGQVSAKAADEANIALYACFSVVGKRNIFKFRRVMSNTRIRILCGQCCQLHRYQMESVLWRPGLLRLRSFVPLLHPHPEHWLQHLCRCSAWLLRRYAVVSPGCHHDVLPKRKL